MADFVYVMAYADRLHKIGFSNNPFRRLSELQQQDGARIGIVKTWERRGNDAQIIEAQAHQLLAYHRAPDARSDEVFEVGEYAACLAVELAQELVDARPVRVGRTVPLSASMAAAHLSGVAEKTSWFGYLPPFCSHEKDRQVVAMCEQGVPLDRIYSDRRSVIKALRPGDVLLVEPDNQTGWESILAKGVEVRAIWLNPALTGDAAAEKIGISPSTAYRKLGNRDQPIFGRKAKS